MTACYELPGVDFFTRRVDLPYPFTAECYPNSAVVFVRADADWPDVRKALRRRRVFYSQARSLAMPSEREGVATPEETSFSTCLEPVRPGWWRMKR